jgi:hypothetical protein
VSAWEYLVVALPEFKAPTAAQGESDSVTMLNKEGAEGWEAVGIATVGDGTVAVLLKRSAEVHTPDREF